VLLYVFLAFSLISHVVIQQALPIATSR
jgi:hypothetical protein